MSNPVLNESRWDAAAHTFGSDSVMTVNGAVTKTGILLILMLAAGAGMWVKFWNHGAIDVQGAIPFAIGGAIGGLLFTFVISFFPKTAGFIAPLYAICEGLFLGAITMIFNRQFPGLPLEAGCLTTATLLGMLFLYQAHIIRATPMLVRGVMIGLFGLVFGSVALWVLGMFGIGSGVVAAINGNGMIGIGFSVFCVGLAALSLVMNFAIIEQGARDRAPRGMEWYAAFGLMVTLVWLYIEILVLLSKLQRRD